MKVCPFNDKLCIHPDWIDCQFQYSMDDRTVYERQMRGERVEEGRNCACLPEGINRTEMLEALGAFGEGAKRRVLDDIKRGVYGRRKREMYKRG